MRALERKVFDAVFAAASPLLPRPVDTHPLGCHRRRVPDRLCLWAILVRLVTGCSWVDAERLVGGVSDTTLRARRDEWTAAGVFDQLAETMLAAYDTQVGLAVGDACVDGSLHKAPCGGDGTGKSPVDRGKLGWKWSLATDRNGIPIGWVVDAANRHDIHLLAPTLADVAARGLLADIDTLHLDRGYDAAAIRAHVAALGIPHLDGAAKRRTRSGVTKTPVALGQRWAAERTNSWLSNYGQLRRNTDRRPEHRRAQLAFVVAILLAARLLDNQRLPPRRRHLSA